MALEYAQMEAMTSGRSTKVTIDESDETVLLEHFKFSSDILGGGNQLDENDVENGTLTTMQHPIDKGGKYKVFFKLEDRFKGVDIVSSAFGGGNNVTFSALGEPSAGGNAVLSLGSSQLTVTLAPLTGKVSID